MGFLDPVYNGVNTVIAGAGSVAGGAVSSGKSPPSHLPAVPISPILHLLPPPQATANIPILDFSRHRNRRNRPRRRRLHHQRRHLMGRLRQRHRELHHGRDQRLRLAHRHPQQPARPRALPERGYKLWHEQCERLQTVAEKQTADPG